MSAGKRTKPEGKYQELPLDLVDEPELAARETLDEVKLQELAESIAQLGVLEPILVSEREGRYRIHAGHRRYLASIMAGRTTIPAIVRVVEGHTGEAIKVHENVHREDLNPGEEAVYLAQLLEQLCHGDVDELCKLVRQKRSYVEERLILLRGDTDVLGALKQQRISFAVARELNKVRDRGFRLVYLENAIKGGASARLVAQWRADSEKNFPEGTLPELPPPETPAPAAAGAHSQMVCFLCEQDCDHWDLEILWAHRACRRVMLRERGAGSA